MKRITISGNALLMACVLQLGACSSGGQRETTQQTTDAVFADPVVDYEAVAADEVPDEGWGERIDGPANVREASGGAILYSLRNGANVQCGMLENGWYEVTTYVQLTKEQYEAGAIPAGTNLRDDQNRIIGRTMAEVSSVRDDVTDDGRYFALLYDYTHKDNIRPESMLEHKFKAYFLTVGDRFYYKQFQEFIDDDLSEESDQFPGYIVRFAYQNWVVDPSPGARLALIFEDKQEQRLVAVKHSRPLQLPGMTDHDLGRGYWCLVMDDYANAAQLLEKQRAFVHAVD